MTEHLEVKNFDLSETIQTWIMHSARSRLNDEQN